MAPRASFPDVLPQELRDEIYAHLLHAESVRSAPPLYRQPAQDRSRAPIYRFHPQILGVNKQIRAEALKVLERNRFIVVSHQWPGLEDDMHFGSVSIVTEQQTQVARFKRHVMRIHLQCPVSSENKSKTKHQAHEIRSFLMVATDLPAFCQKMQWKFYRIPAPCAYITFVGNGKADRRHDAWPCVPTKHVVTTKIQLRSPNQHEHKLEAVKALIGPFNSMICASQKATFSGFDQHQAAIDVQRLQLRMGPRMVSTNAMAWHMLDTVQRLLRRAEDLAISCEDYEGACRQYQVIWVDALAYPLFKLSLETYDSELALPLALVACALLDAAANWGFLQLRLGGIFRVILAEVWGSVDTINKFLQSTPVQVHTLVAYSLEKGITNLGACHFLAVAAFITEVGENSGFSTPSQLRFERLHRAAPHCGHIQHDLEMVERIAGDPKVSTFTALSNPEHN
ncbi:hypothetical protein LTR36_001255 [Oleoguttula mirabilis]|uniref:Uncharacterized protein n=1 Tax=Oleoguttula mirabilis TaxID=1507867 RepID=A0AAV9JR66_9PEZI|nr:hypothetical protein LTR36_001255 [Oleoguttula mirabilis]